tara:strand:- start:8409 stop:8816 length:408 start_codon:yes stop_codon:yes gene_type:complete
MATKYYKFSSKNAELSYESDTAFREEHQIVDGHNEFAFSSTLTQMIADSKATVTEQFFDTNKSFHKLEIASDTDAAQLDTLLGDITSFSICNIEEISESDYTTEKGTDKVFAEYGDPNKARALRQNQKYDGTWTT